MLAHAAGGGDDLDVLLRDLGAALCADSSIVGASHCCSVAVSCASIGAIAMPGADGR